MHRMRECHQRRGTWNGLPSLRRDVRRDWPALLGAFGLLLGAAGVASADLGTDLLDDVGHSKLLDVSRFDGEMPAGADEQFGLSLSQSAALDSAPELENGTDLGFVQDKRDNRGLGKAGLIVGDVDEEEVDVRGGFYKGTTKGFVIFAWQMGEPESIKRQADKVTVSQTRDLAIFVNVTTLSGAILSETDVAQVKKCSVKATFANKNDENIDENLPDKGAWKVVCDKGWADEFEVLTDDGVNAIKKVMGGSAFKLEGGGAWADLDQVLDDFDIPFL